MITLNRLAASVGVAFAVTGSALAIWVTDVLSWFNAFGGFMALLSLAFGALVWLLIARQPRNRMIWTLTAASFGAGWWLLGLGVASVLVRGDAEQVALVVSIGGLIPAEVDPAAVRVMMLAESIGLTGLYFSLTFGLLLFPDGRLPSERWRWVGRFSAVAVLLAFLAALQAFRSSRTHPTGDDLVYGFATLLASVAFILCLSALVSRFRRSTRAERDQVRWVVWGASAFVIAIVISIVLGNLAGLAVALVGELAFLIAFAVAVSRHRLFDVDVVISRTVVVAGLAAFITLVYAVLVGAVGLFVGFGTQATLPLSIAATVVVAIAFQPLQRRMRRWADRLVYGDRATPYEVLSRFSSQIRDTVATDEAIPYLARLLAEGTGAESTTVWIRGPDGLRPAGVWPQRDTRNDVAAEYEELVTGGQGHVVRVEEDGELIGAVSVVMPASESLTPAEQRLIDDAASQAGMVLRNAQLIQDLQASRQRLVAAQDEERRRIERDLHDGAQQQFVAVKMKASMASQLIDRGDADRASELLSRVVEELDDGVQTLRELAHGIYPPLLEAEGLPTALRAQARTAPISVSVSADGLGRYPPDVEAAIYFCVLEALQNTIKHGAADHVDITLTQEGDLLRLRVTDDGRGFDPQSHRQSRGLTNMADRIEVLGGKLAIESSPGNGTSITGVLEVLPALPGDG